MPAENHNHDLPPPSEQLCYVHCNHCNTLLAVTVPRSMMLGTVRVRCGNCTTLLSVTMPAHLPPPAEPENQKTMLPEGEK